MDIDHYCNQIRGFARFHSLLGGHGVVFRSGRGALALPVLLELPWCGQLLLKKDTDKMAQAHFNWLTLVPGVTHENVHVATGVAVGSLLNRWGCGRSVGVGFR